MKAISIRAPWWWCILYAGKRIENRSLNFARYTGPVLLHASSWWSLRQVDQQWQDAREAGWIGEDVKVEKWTYNMMKTCGGCIIGRADIVSVQKSDEDWLLGEHDPYETPGGLALVLDNVRAFKTPVPYKGSRGLFEVPWDTETDSLKATI